MIFFDDEKFHEVVKDIETKFTFMERRNLINVLTERMNESRQRLKQNDLINNTLGKGPFGKLAKMVSGKDEFD